MIVGSVNKKSKKAANLPKNNFNSIRFQNQMHMHNQQQLYDQKMQLIGQGMNM